jgi:WD40 repeat protein
VGSAPTVVGGRFWRRLAVGVGAALAVGLVCFLAFAGMRAGRDRGEASVPKEGGGRIAPSPSSWRKSGTLHQASDRAVCALAFSPDARSLAVRWWRYQQALPGEIIIWDFSLSRLSETIPTSGGTFCLDFSPDGETLAWAVGDAPKGKGEVTLWSMADRKPRTTFVAHAAGASRLAFQPHGKLLATCGFRPADKGKEKQKPKAEVRLWDAATGRQEGRAKDFPSEVCAVAFSPDGERLVVGCHDGSVHTCEMATLEWLGQLPHGRTGQPIKGLAFSPDGETLLASTAAAGSLAKVLVWTGRGRRAEAAIELDQADAYTVAFAPDGETFLVGCQNGTGWLYRTATRENLQTLRDDHGFLVAAFSPDGKLLATGGSWNKPVRLWEPEE